MPIKEIIQKMNLEFSLNLQRIEQIKHEDDNEYYQVWKVYDSKKIYIFKEAKKYEAELYLNVLSKLDSSVPALYGHTVWENKDYILIEYIEGRDLRHCTRDKLILALDSLIYIQKMKWNDTDLNIYGYNFEKSILERNNRIKYLNNSELEEAYSTFLAEYKSVPRTLCHDDLLPFNVKVNENEAVLIDREYAGLLPYPTSFARLIAHGEENEQAFFYLSEADRNLAINYYYDQLLKDKGISKKKWLKTLSLFIFYEYCEWVFVGNKYLDKENERYKKYLKLSLNQAKYINHFYRIRF